MRQAAQRTWSAARSVRILRCPMELAAALSAASPVPSVYHLAPAAVDLQVTASRTRNGSSLRTDRSVQVRTYHPPISPKEARAVWTGPKVGLVLAVEPAEAAEAAKEVSKGAKAV